MHVVTGIFAFDVRLNGTFQAPYPAGTVQADFTGSTANTLVVDQAPLSHANGDISISFGSSEITVTNLTTRTLKAGLRFWLQLEVYSPVTALAGCRAAQPRDLMPIAIGSGVTLAGNTLTGTGGGGGDITQLTLTVAELKALTGYSVNDLQAVYDDSYGWSTYVLKAGTDSESAPNVYRPNDYDGATNAFVWKKAV